MKKALIIFTRNAELGKVKTRLAATLGNAKTFAIYTKLVTHTIEVTKQADANRFIYYASYIPGHDEWNATHFTKRLQHGNDLGERMHLAFEELFTDGYQLITIIGTDCPGITKDIIDEAFNALQHADIAIGPAKDGGYYLLAMKKMNAEIFQNISWSTGEVLLQTLDCCRSLKLSTHLLPELTDVDVEEDLEGLQDFFIQNHEHD